MIYNVVFSDRSRKELEESWAWYEERQHGLGDRFSEAILNVIEQIETNPDKGLSRNTRFKEAIVKTFPFLVIYRVDKKDKVIFISSIFHSNRNPKGKYKV